MDLEVSSSFPRTLAKLYLLDDDNEWIDQGTGYPTVENAGKKGYFLRFTAEDTNKELHSLEINENILFDRKEEKIISWYNEKTSVDMALSFQNSAGAALIWAQLEEVIEILKTKLLEGHARADSIDSSTFNYDLLENDIFLDETTLTFPSNAATFYKISMELAVAITQERKVQISILLTTKKQYLNKFQELFAELEEKQDFQALQQLHGIFKQIISLAEHELLDLLMSDEYYLFVFGVLEYDGDMLSKAKVPHRLHFKQIATFREVAEIKDKEIIRWIHVNYRLLYLRDCALAHFLDERTLNLITIIVFNIYGEIIKYLHGNKEFLSSLFDNLRNHNIMALRFIHEIFTLLKVVEIDKIELIEIFHEYNLFETLEEMLKTQTNAKKSASSANGAVKPLQNLPKSLKTQKKKNKSPENLESFQRNAANYISEIIIISLQFAPSFFRNYITSQNQKFQKYPFLSLICDNFLNNEDSNIKILFADILKSLLEVDKQNAENAVLDIFIDNFLPRSLKLFENSLPECENLTLTRQLLLEILTNSMKFINNKWKDFFMSFPAFASLFAIARSTKSKSLALSCVQFFKSLLFSKNPELVAILEPAVRIFLEIFAKLSLRRQNLLFSAILDAFRFVYEEKLSVFMQTIENALKTLPTSPIHAFMERMFAKYAKSEGKQLNLSAISFENRGNYFLNDFLLDNVEEESAVRDRELKKTAASHHIKSSAGEEKGTPNKLVDYEEEEEESFEKTEHKRRKLDESGNFKKV